MKKSLILLFLFAILPLNSAGAQCLCDNSTCIFVPSEFKESVLVKLYQEGRKILGVRCGEKFIAEGITDDAGCLVLDDLLTKDNINYVLRFTKDNETIIPDEVWFFQNGNAIVVRKESP